MTERSEPPRSKEAPLRPKPAQDEKAAARAAALRENLRRRKGAAKVAPSAPNMAAPLAPQDEGKWTK